MRPTPQANLDAGPIDYPRWSYFAALAASAVPLALAFPEPGWALLAHAALVPAALLAVGAPDTRRLAWTSYVVWVAWWLTRVSWLIPVTLGGYVALSLYLALYGPAALLATRRLYRRYGLPMTFALPMAWVSLEVVRTYIPAGGFSWFLLGHSQAPYAPDHGPGRLIQIADVFGEHGVSFLVAMTNGLIADLWLAYRAMRQATQPRIHRRMVVLAGACWLLSLSGTWLYGYYRVGETDADSDRPGFEIAVVQTNVPQDNKNSPTRESMLHDWQRLVALTREAKTRWPTTQLIVWPETMVLTGLNRDAIEHDRGTGSGRELFHKEIQSLARELNTNLLVGAHAYFDWRVIRSPDGQSYFEIPNKRYNSAFLYRPDGSQSPQRYDKVHRVPFGEYIPWVEQWPWLKRQFIRFLSPYEVDYTIQPGLALTVFAIPAANDAHGPNHPTGQEATPTSHTRIVTPICFEDAVARVTRRMVYAPDGSKRADILLNLTNDGWYTGTDQGPQHLQIAVFRCIESRVPMARSVNTGISGFIDSAGRIGPLVTVDGHRQGVEGVAGQWVRLDRRRTLFARLGHAPAIGLAAVTSVLIVGGLPWAYLRKRHTPNHQPTADR